MKKIAITGSIGVGKSSLCRILSSQGYSTLDTDQIAKTAFQKKSPIYSDIIQLFQSDSQQGISTKDIADKIFSNPVLKRKFENIVHPYTLKEILKIEKRMKQKDHSILFYEVPLLFEAHWENHFDWVILMTCDQALQIERVKKRSTLSSFQIQQRIKGQIPLNQKKRKSHILIENNQNLEHLKRSAILILNQIHKKENSL